MLLLFAVTLFVSASLLFMVQPMVGKMILPLLGGSPAVWNACMVFFQALLLLGYLYAHYISTRYSPKKQWAIHTLVLLLPIAVMAFAAAAGVKHTPIAVVESLAPSGDTSPLLASMALLGIAIGVPFFVASTSAPLLQKWFAYTGHPSASDPYFLYAASNAGSLISLLGYPLLIEPTMLLAWQTWLWAIGFVVLVGLIIRCGKAAVKPVGVPPVSEALAAREYGANPEDARAAYYATLPSRGRVLKWIVLAFVPSSLMLGVTFHMTTDIASIPLLWVVPLALYLVTFIIAFGRVPAWLRLVIGNLAPVMILLLVFVMASGATSGRPAITLTVHIAAFFAAALMCHYELALDRPKDVAHLTGYFLCMSIGGVLGGLFNALIAPMVFTSTYEYPLTLVMAAFLVPNLNITEEEKRARAESLQTPTELERYKARLARILDFVFPAAIGLMFWLLVSVVPRQEWYGQFVGGIVKQTTVSQNAILAIVSYAVPVMACFFFVDRPLRFGLSVAVLLGMHLYRDRDPDIVYTERSFFGVLKVEDRGYFTRLVHGTTLHGTQINQPYLVRFDTPVPFGAFSTWEALALEGALASWNPKEEPLTYYHRTGPVGAMFHEIRTRKNGADAKAHFAMVGLGTGSVSCYALPGQKLTFYEIDPAVRRIVETPWMVMNKEEVAEKGAAPIMGPFTFVDDARKRGAEIDFRMGDARLKLKEDSDRKYTLLLVDAFSSDAIPVHLLTKEAVQLYLDRLTDDGILALHISNKYVRLEPVVARICEELGLSARVWNDESESRPGKTASSWVAVARNEQTLGTLAAPPIEQIIAFGTKNHVLIELLKKYGPTANVKDALTKEYGSDFSRKEAAGPANGTNGKEGGLAVEDFIKRHGPLAGQLVEQARRSDLAKESPDLARLARVVFGPMFRPLQPAPEVRLWTDDYTDVLQVMMLKEVQSIRRALGFSTPGVEE